MQGNVIQMCVGKNSGQDLPQARDGAKLPTRLTGTRRTSETVPESAVSLSIVPAIGIFGG